VPAIAKVSRALYAKEDALPARRKFGASQKERLFFAVLPPPAGRDVIHALAEAQKRACGFDGTLIRPEHLHVTLFHLGDWIALPAELVAQANQAATSVAAAGFEVRFDKLASFRNRTGVRPFVLTGPSEAWRPLRLALGQGLKQVGLGAAVHDLDDFTPHVTLLRDEKSAKAQKIDPITWQVQDFVLVQSLLGKTTHIHLGRWPLQAK
jgi:RNA 2',3'-cyclic 3'-phosphodiesterase